MTRRLTLAAAHLLLVLAVAGCRSETLPGVVTETPAGPPASRGSITLSGDMAADRAELQRLESHARAAARVEGCDAAGSCAAAPLGAKACGGPRDHVVYCRLSTDEAELTASLAALERFEREFNQRYGIASNCALEMPPAVGASGGSCRAGG